MKSINSLRQKLLTLIKSLGYLSYGDMCQFVAEEGYKTSTAERRLRGLCSDKDEQKRPQEAEIEPVMATSKRNTPYIAAWKVKTAVPTIKLPPPFAGKNNQPQLV